MTGPARILLADDDDGFRRVAARLLSSHGYVVDEAVDAHDALARLAGDLFDLLIADVNMPGNDGLAVLHGQDLVPVLIVTGEPSLDTAVEALRGAAIDYLAKPLAPERFLARVADGVARGRALRSLRSAEQRLRDQLELVTSLRASLAFADVNALTGELTAAAAGLPASIAALVSPREREVLLAFRANPRTGAVAEELHISPHTVKNHLKAIFRKLDVSSQAELLARLSEAERDGR